MKLNGACLKADKLAKKSGYQQVVYIHQIGLGNKATFDAGLTENTEGVLFYVLRPKEKP